MTARERPEHDTHWQHTQVGRAAVPLAQTGCYSPLCGTGFELINKKTKTKPESKKEQMRRARKNGSEARCDRGKGASLYP
jgi:hypothetical protein